jgi:hypothetical protein
MSFFGNLFGRQTTAVDLNTLNLQSTDPLVTRVSNMLTAAGLGNDSNFNLYVDQVLEVTRRYQELDSTAMLEYINRVDDVKVSKQAKTSSTLKTSKSKKTTTKTPKSSEVEVVINKVTKPATKRTQKRKTLVKK